MYNSLSMKSVGCFVFKIYKYLMSLSTNVSFNVAFVYFRSEAYLLVSCI